MRFGLFYEHQLPRPWSEGAEEKLLTDALEQIELADRLGFDSVWEVEHHFLEEYSHSSAPEVFLAAASQRTKRIRLGHGIVQLPPPFNATARVAERIATLDLVSGGRVEFGTGESSSQMELGGYGVPREEKHAMWEEALDVVVRMMTEEPFAGHDGRYLTVPQRNVIPKPKQKPHPPLWMACSRRDSIPLAGKKGLGALSFSFIEPEDSKEWVDAYQAALTSDDCVPAGLEWNPNFAVVVPLMVHEDERTAIDRGIDGAHFFGYSLAHYYVFGRHRPGFTDVWEEFEQHRGEFGFAREIVTADAAPLAVQLLQEGLGSMRGAIGTPDQVAALVERYERAGVDQVIFVAQAGPNLHEHICESIELFAGKVLPRFAEAAAEREQAKRERLADARERALAHRAERPPPPAPDPDYLVAPSGEPRPAPMLRPVPAGGRDEPLVARLAAGRDRLRSQAAERFGRFLKGKTDAQLDRIVGSRAVMRAIFRGMVRSFRPQAARGFEGRIQYLLRARGRTHAWTVSLRDGSATVRPGRASDPKVTLSMSVPTFARVLSREIEAGRAFLDGRIRVEGDLSVAARLGEMFPRS